MASIMTKAQLYQAIADDLGEDFSRSDVKAVLEATADVVADEMSKALRKTKQGTEISVMVGDIATVKAKKKPKTKAGKRMMFGELREVAAQPASVQVKALIRPPLKNAINS